MTADSGKITAEVKAILGAFDTVGVAPRERLEAAPAQYNPRNLMPDYQAVIVFAEGNKNDYSTHTYMGSFGDYLATLATQTEAVRYLHAHNYKAVIIPGSSREVGLVRMGVQAGLGELSPVNSLVVKGHGLTVTLGAIITDAPLAADELAEGVCIRCMQCLEVCPARSEAYESGDLDKCGCGKCRHTCPV